MRILCTNDDGIHATGLAVLEKIARTFSDDVWVIAPESEQSGASRALTLSAPIREVLRLSPILLVVFDCDGTLVDSQAVIVACMRQAFERQGLEPAEQGDSPQPEHRLEVLERWRRIRHLSS